MSDAHVHDVSDVEEVRVVEDAWAACGLHLGRVQGVFVVFRK